MPACSITKLSRREIEHAFSQAIKVESNTYFTMLRADPLFEYKEGKILILIPKKVGSAPQRNKLRRRIKEIARKAEIEKKVYVWIIIARKENRNFEFQRLKDFILRGLSKK